MTECDGHRLVRDFFSAATSGEIPEDLVTGDMTAWVLTSGDLGRDRFLGAFGMLAAIVEGGPVYDIHALTAEEDRVVAEVSSDWALINGQRARNRHVFSFRIRDGRIAFVAEYMDPAVARDIIGPLIQATLAGQQ